MARLSGVGRTVVLHPGALGDVLLAVPALRALRACAPGDELVLAGQPRIGALLTSFGIVDRNVPFETLGLEALFTEDDAPARLRDLVDGARLVSWFGMSDQAFARRLRALAPYAIVAAATAADGASVWEHLVASLDARPRVGAEQDAWRAPISISPAVVAEGRRLLLGAGWNGAIPLVMLHPGAGGAAKCWAPEGFAALAELLVASAGVELIVHDGPADHDAVTGLRRRLGVPALALTDPPLEALAGALAHVALWVGNDSGVSHLAAAVGAPALVLFAEANLAWRPWARGTRTLVVSTGRLSPADGETVIAEAKALLGQRERRPIGAGEVR
jgi:heptosyltransferase-3